jgi:uncharacterized protein (DUF1499 family)
MTRVRLGTIAAVAMVLGVGLAWARLVPAIAGFGLFVLGGITALGVVLASAFQAVRGHRFGVGGVLASLLVVVLLWAASPGFGRPRINDYTTDPADPPAFGHAATLPANAGRDLRYPPDFAAQQQACCADLHPAHLAGMPADAFTTARRVAAGMPRWTVTEADPTAGTIEAVVTSRIFGFQDDVALRIRPDPAGGSRIDVRSKSRDGKGDMGVNADRIRAYVAALESDARAR